MMKNAFANGRSARSARGVALEDELNTLSLMGNILKFEKIKEM